MMALAGCLAPAAEETVAPASAPTSASEGILRPSSGTMTRWSGGYPSSCIHGATAREDIQETRTYPSTPVTPAFDFAIAEGEGPTSASLRTTEAYALSWAAADLITVQFDADDLGMHVLPWGPSGGAEIDVLGDAQRYRRSDDVACARE